ncbi:hypothetical protein [Viridibacillus arvi]|uniref:hypothetical protein n=1 Tax=Viridibacillus arvi TaxID=263475 RepID=UPI0034CE242A
MFRVNDLLNELMTLAWLEQMVVEMKEINQVWPYLTIKGFVRENEKNVEAATIEQVIKFMIKSNYAFICVSHTDESGYKEIIFKYNNR